MNQISNLLLVSEDNTIGNLFLTPDYVKWLFTSPADKLNVTVIEFSVTALQILSRMKYERLVPEDPVLDEVVSVYQYCEESLIIGKGHVNKVIGEVIEYTLDTREYCSGFPLLNKNLKVVGIHVNSNKLEKRGILKAISIESILEAFKTFITEKLGGQTENELWLEKIAQIPKDEFHLIGSGGFGKVYKIKESNSPEKFVAVKVVSRLGNLDEYKIDALQKEYRLVTSLENHPRIIQFFAIVPDNRNYQIMIVMEYMECGSIADKLRDNKPLPDDSLLKYLTQILEGVSFLHRKKIYHSDIKPANILLTAQDNIKIIDFGTAVESQLLSKSCVTDENESDSCFEGDIHYMSPERLQGADRSAANDIWSVGATFVYMITGQPLNHFDTITQLIFNISQYKVCINGRPYSKYIQTLNDNDFKKKILLRTLCTESNRANCQKLLRILIPHSRRLPLDALIMEGGRLRHPIIYGMCYNSARDELFLADHQNSVVSSIRLHDNAGDLRDVYRTAEDSRVYSVCHMSDSDSLLVCSFENWQDELAYWLVLLSREGSYDWFETHRVQTAAAKGMLCCALSDSQALVGEYDSTYMELFRVQNGARIAHVQLINMSEQYNSFSATCGSDTLVAILYVTDKSVRVNRLRGDRLEELARLRLQNPNRLLWLADLLLVAERNADQTCDAVTEFELHTTQLERCRELIAPCEGIQVDSMCALPSELDLKSEALLLYSFYSEMSPIGGNEEYETILYLPYFECDFNINLNIFRKRSMRKGKESSKPEADDWKSKNDRENIAT